MLFQIVLDTVTCLILMLTLSRLFTHRVAFVSSLFYALDPFLVFYCSTLLSDILFVFLLVLSFYAFAAAYRSAPGGKSDWYYASFGLLLGIATLVRPVSVYIPLFIFLFFFASYLKDKMRAIRLTAICLITFFLAISPWLFRNYVTFDRLSLSTAGQFNLLFYWVEPMEMERLKIDRASAEKLLDAEVEREIASDGLDPQKVNQFQLADYHQRLAVRAIVENPLTFAKTYTKGIIFNFFNLNTEGFARHLHMRTAGVDKRWYSSIKDMLSDFISRKPSEAILIGGLVLFFLAITYSLSVVGFVTSWSRYDHKVLLFLLLMSSYFILLTGAAGVARYKLPSLPFYLCFAGIGFEYVHRRAIQLRKNARLDLRP
jgi:4-amino-4-deoxy-L-arabinose transferase-like glycosyltransferase